MKAVGSFIILRKAHFSFFVFLHFDTENFLCDFVVTYATFLKIQTYAFYLGNYPSKALLKLLILFFKPFPKHFDTNGY